MKMNKENIRESLRRSCRKAVPVLMTAALICVCLPLTASADSSKVVTLGANLSDSQKKDMYEYFGTSADAVETIEVTNKDERKYMEGIATEAQIGTRTFSCSYVEPTTDGGIQVKVANLTFVTSSMIASTLLTSGMENCNVVAASPIEVSGTGALTGIMMAYESASGEELNEEQKEAATEELVTTGELADDVGQQEASDIMNQVKQDVIEDNLSEDGEIKDAVNNAADSAGVTLTDEQVDQITELMKKIAQYDYDVNALKDTLDNLSGKSEGFFDKIGNFFKGIFGGSDSDGGILNNTNDDVLGDNAVVDSTLDGVKDKIESADSEGFFDKIVNFFKGLFGGDDADTSDTTDSSSDNASGSDSSDSGESDTSDSSSDVSDTSEDSGNGNDTSAEEDNNSDDSNADTTSDGGSSDNADTTDEITE